jgi:hypothetical protein
MVMDNIRAFIFDEEVDFDAIVEELGLDWRQVFEELAHSLELIAATAEPTLRFRLRLFGNDLDLTDAIVDEPGGDWRRVVERFASDLDTIFGLVRTGQGASGLDPVDR